MARPVSKCGCADFAWSWTTPRLSRPQGSPQGWRQMAPPAARSRTKSIPDLEQAAEDPTTFDNERCRRHDPQTTRSNACCRSPCRQMAVSALEEPHRLGQTSPNAFDDRLAMLRGNPHRTARATGPSAPGQLRIRAECAAMQDRPARHRPQHADPALPPVTGNGRG